MLADLRRAGREAATKYPARVLPGLGYVGLILMRTLLPRWYESFTPVNGWTFATTGMDGTHFSLLARAGAVRANSPVVVTIPAAAQNFVVGEDLFDFLCLGMVRGYHVLGQLAYDTDPMLRVLTDPTWQPTEDWHDSADFVPGGRQLHVLKFLTKRFGLRPWPNARHFDELQERFGPEVELPPFLAQHHEPVRAVGTATPLRTGAGRSPGRGASRPSTGVRPP
jgi:hypothetical protein